MQSDSTKKGAAFGGRGLSATAGKTASASSKKPVSSPMMASHQSSTSQVPTLEMELQENPDLVYDPLSIRKMLLVKIGQLGDTIRNV